LDKKKGSLTITKWIVFTTLGWVIGLIIAIIIADPLEKINLDLFGLGLGITTGIGLMQWIVLRRYTTINYKWMWLTIAGMSGSFLLFNIILDVLNALDFKVKMDGVPAMITITIAVALGGFLTGQLQRKLLKKNNFTNTHGWVLYSFLEWTTCSILISVYFVFMNNVLNLAFTNVGKLMNLLAFLLIGPILGYISGKKILTILHTP
jgi:uncharacterized protein YacL